MNSPARIVSVAWEGNIAVVTIDNPLFGPMHWQPAPLLEKLVREGKSLADFQGAK